MPLVYIPAALQRPESLLLVLSSPRVCVKVKTEPDYRAFKNRLGGLPLDTGSGGIPGPKRCFLKPNLKEFGKCVRGHFTGSEYEDETVQ